MGDYDIVTDQDEFGTVTSPGRILRADVRAQGLGLRGDAAQHWGKTKVAFGLDLNGRFDLQAEDITIDFDLSGAQTQESSFTTIEDAQRMDGGIYVTADHALTSAVSLAGGLRYDRVRSTNTGGFFGDRSVKQCRPSGTGVTFAPSPVSTPAVAHGFRDAGCPTASSGRHGCGSSPGTPAHAQTANSTTSCCAGGTGAGALRSRLHYRSTTSSTLRGRPADTFFLPQTAESEDPRLELSC